MTQEEKNYYEEQKKLDEKAKPLQEDLKEKIESGYLDDAEKIVDELQEIDDQKVDLSKKRRGL